jgi:hypothetical protein
MHVQDAGQFLADAHAALEKVRDAEQLLAIAHAAREKAHSQSAEGPACGDETRLSRLSSRQRMNEPDVPYAEHLCARARAARVWNA